MSTGFAGIALLYMIEGGEREREREAGLIERCDTVGAGILRKYPNALCLEVELHEGLWLCEFGADQMANHIHLLYTKADQLHFCRGHPQTMTKKKTSILGTD